MGVSMRQSFERLGIWHEKYQLLQPNIAAGSLYFGRITGLAECDKADNKIPLREIVGQVHHEASLFALNVDDNWIGVRDSDGLFSIIPGVRYNT
jgi:hypothetical protein